MNRQVIVSFAVGIGAAVAGAVLAAVVLAQPGQTQPQHIACPTHVVGTPDPGSATEQAIANAPPLCSAGP